MNTKIMAGCVCILVAFLLLLGGCTSTMGSYYTSEVPKTPASQPSDISKYACTPGTCTCMLCSNNSALTQGSTAQCLYSLFYDYGLDGGSCQFSPCSQQSFLDDAKGSGNLHPWFFMIGQGSNFAEFEDANRYCNNSLRLAVKWIVSKDGEYLLPAEDRASCFLNKNTLPAYLLFSNGTEIDPVKAGAIAKQFSGAGPVMLVSEMDFDPTNSSQVQNAKQEAIAMKQNCQNCLIGISPKFIYNGTNYNATYVAIDTIFSDPQAAADISFVAVGVNSHYSRDCSSAGLIFDAMVYSQYIMQNHSKPTLWVYALFDPSWNWNEDPAKGGCVWPEGEIVKAYSDMFKYSPALVGSGVIGVAPYSLYGVKTGPLRCDNCSLISIDDSLNPGSVRSPRHTVWFSLCQNYYTGKGQMPIVFSPNPCTDCSFRDNFNLFQMSSLYTGASPTSTQLSGQEVQKMDTFYRCDERLVHKMPDIHCLSESGIAASASSSICENYPQIDSYADILDADPALARAFAWSESGIDNTLRGAGGDTCEISQVDKAKFPNLPTSLDDPEGYCGLQTASAGKTFHSIGVMQVHMYPYTMWNDPNYRVSAYEDDAKWCGGEMFNPFNPDHNICLGNLIVLDKLSSARTYVKNHESALGLQSSSSIRGQESDDSKNMRNAITAFLGSYYYNGYASTSKFDGWVSGFSHIKAVNQDYCSNHKGEAPCCGKDGNLINSDCCNYGPKNFIDYAYYCQPLAIATPDAAANSNAFLYGFRVLGRYKALLEDCDKYDEQSWLDSIKKYVGGNC